MPRRLLFLGLAGCASTASSPTPDRLATLVVSLKDQAGQPVAGLAVRVFGGTAQPARAVSDAHGEVRFSTEDGVLQVILDDPAQVPIMTYGELKPGATVRADLMVVDPVVVTGTVLDAAGQAIQAAKIEILPIGMALPPATITDGSGRFTSVLSVGSWRVKAAKEGKSDTWTTLEIAEGQHAAAVSLTVPDAASLTVETNCEVLGCVGASVEVSVANSGFSQGLQPDGRGSFTGLPIGEAVVTVRDDSDPRHPRLGEARLALAPGVLSRAQVTVAALDASARVSGHLVERDGKPATSSSGSQLVVDVSFHGFSRRAVAAADGKFEVPDIVPGECDVTALRIDPTDPMSGANGLRSVTKAVAPATGLEIAVNDFFSGSEKPK